MTKLIGHGVETSNIFTLYGEHEEAATHGVGFLLLHSPTFLEMFMKSLEKDTNIHGKDMEKITIEVEKPRKDAKRRGGRTDIEVGIEGDFRLIIEAKRWGPVIGKGQLKKYADLLTEKDGKVCFMTLSRSDKRQHSEIFDTSGKHFPVIHRSWGDIRELVKQASEQTRKKRDNNDLENILLTHLYIHLENYVHHEKGDTCVFHLNGNRRTEVKDYTYLDVVTKGGGYFHPYTNDYPERAPKYLGFRWGKNLCRVHKVKEAVIGKESVFGREFSSTGNGSLAKNELMWRDVDDSNHVIYILEKDNLLPDYIEGRESIPTKLIGPRAKHHWCDLESLRSVESLQEAVKKTNDAREKDSNDRIKKAEQALRNLWEKTNQGDPPTPYPQTLSATPNPAPRGEGQGAIERATAPACPL